MNVMSIQDRMKVLGINARELAIRTGLQPQNISAFINGRRQIPLRASILLDVALEQEKGTIMRRQTEENIQKEIMHMNQVSLEKRKKEILEKVKGNGGLWSYRGIPERMPDDEIIEEGLRHLDFEDMDLIFRIWNKAHIKRVWKERLVSEGKRLNALNTLLGIIFFNIDDIDKYLRNNGRN